MTLSAMTVECKQFIYLFIYYFLHAQYITKQSKHKSSGTMPTVQAFHDGNCIALLDSYGKALNEVPYYLYYTPVSNKRRSLINAWCKPTAYEINAGSLINARGRGTICSNNRTCYGNKEKSAHCNN